MHPSKQRLLPRLLAIASLLIVPVFANSSVWKAQKGDSVIYLGGTCHLLRPSDFPLPPEFETAYAEASLLVFETDIEAMGSPAIQAMMMRIGTYQDGTTLRDHVKAETWEVVSARAVGLGLPPALVSSMRPWMLSITLSVLEMQKLGATDTGVDVHFHQRALADGKASLGIETIENHIGLLANIEAVSADDLLLSTLDDIERADEILEAVISSWRTGDLDDMHADLFAPMREEFPEIYHALLVERNRDWVKKMEAFWETPEVEFILVGAGHFPGDEGVLRLLAAQGVELTQVSATPAEP